MSIDHSRQHGAIRQAQSLFIAQVIDVCNFVDGSGGTTNKRNVAEESVSGVKQIRQPGDPLIIFFVQEILVSGLLKLGGGGGTGNLRGFGLLVRIRETAVTPPMAAAKATT
jgi:hypothetical protein